MADVETVLKEIRQNVESSSNVKVVFGDPVYSDSADGTLKTCVIPVSKSFVMTGGGGGGKDSVPGMEHSRGEHGAGTGIIARTTPLGYVKIENGEAEFVEILDKRFLIGIGAVLALALAIFLKK